MTGDDVGGGGTVDGDPDSNPEFTIVGTCEDMCPEAERLRRSAAGELHMFERVDPANSRVGVPRREGGQNSELMAVFLVKWLMCQNL
jgi:hypothetical protein